MKLHCIPNINDLDDYLRYSEKYHLAFEYNDFFNPALLESKETLKERIHIYQSLNRDMNNDTLHGVFFDITVHSSDPRIRQISDYRIHQSMEIAMELGVRAVIFHTNSIPQLRNDSYKKGWLDQNVEYWRSIAGEYKELHILIENMFDDEPWLLQSLAEQLKEVTKFGVCYDIAHANLSSVSFQTWMDALCPYIKHIHMNDNNKKQDSHDAIGSGSIPWNSFNGWIERIPSEPSVLIEVTGIEKLRRSVVYMEEHKIYPFI